VSIVSAVKAASARFRGFAEARAQSVPLDAGNPFADLNETEVKASLAAIRGAYDAGVAAERTPIEAILQAPGASTFPDIAVDLVLGPATAAQAAGVLARAETDAAKRASLLKTSLLESANASAIH
jgi:hypothetical protein